MGIFSDFVGALFGSSYSNVDSGDEKLLSGKTVPVVTIESVKCHEDGSNMQVTGYVKNLSKESVYLDKLRITGQTIELDRLLNPEASHQYILYRGPKLKTAHPPKAQLVYRSEPAKDYFEADHQVECKIQPEGDFIIVDFHLIKPIRDI